MNKDCNFEQLTLLDIKNRSRESTHFNVVFFGGPLDGQLKAMKELPPVYRALETPPPPMHQPTNSASISQATPYKVYNLHWYDDTNGERFYIYVSEEMAKLGIIGMLLNLYLMIGGYN